MNDDMKGTYESFHSVVAEHREELEEHFVALANIFERAGAGDPITQMTLQPYGEAEMIQIVWTRDTLDAIDPTNRG